MNCLSACASLVLNAFMAQGDKGCCAYTIAEDLADDHKAVDVAAAVDLLQQLGLIRNFGTATPVYKLSAAAMGDVRKGYFSQGGSGSKELLDLQAKLIKLEIAQKDAAEKAAQLEMTGGLGERKPQTTKE